MKHYLLFIALLSFSFAHSQKLTPVELGSGGGYSSVVEGSITYTIADMTMVQTYSSAKGIITQGFEQPEQDVANLITVADGQAGSLAVYPVPAIDNVNFGFELLTPGKVSVELWNAMGVKVADLVNQDYESGKIVQQLNLSTYGAGSYFLTMNFSDNAGKMHSMSRQFQVIR